MPNKSTFGMKLTPRPISPQISGRISKVWSEHIGNPDAQVRAVRDIVKREVFDFNTRYNETPTPEEDAFIDEVTIQQCFARWVA